MELYDTFFELYVLTEDLVLVVLNFVTVPNALRLDRLAVLDPVLIIP